MATPTKSVSTNATATMSGQQETQRMIRPERRQACSLALITAFVLLLATPLAAVPEIEWITQPRTPAAVPAGPGLPDLPVQLILDDGTFETVFGVGGATARQFLWFTQFALPPGAQNLSLQEIWVLFPPGANMMVGDAIELVVYQDFDGDPTNGANLLTTVDETIQTLDGTTFSVYSIPPVEVVGGGDVLIGVVSRFIDSGVTPFPTLPAAVDASVSDGSGWFATWTGDPPNPPELPSDLVMQPFNASFAGVWMIRAFGRPIPDYQVVPSVGTWGLVALALALAFAALRMVRGGAAGVVMLAVATLGVLAGPTEATVVDDFAVAQALLTDPPGAPDTSSVAGGLGAARDLFVDRVTGGGSVSAEVAMGALDIDITDDTPDTRGEVVASWDGADGDPALDPIGLGGLDLTVDAGSVQTGFDLDLISAVTGVEVTIEVFTDAANASRIDLVLLSTQTSYLLGYDEFVASLGAGADFSNVGAIVMTIRSTEKAVSVDRLATTGPVVVGLLADALVAASDADMDGNADPGDVLRYTATISNTGTEADDVDVAETLADLTFVPGSVRTTPIARNDRYDDACGNVTLTVLAAQGVLANDFDIDTNALGVDVAMSDTASIQGATVTMAADGGFVYSPPPGFGGVDSFEYQLALVAGDPTPPGPIRGTVTMLIDERVWFVDNDHGGTNQGTQANPFQTLTAVEAVAQAGDTIFIFEAANTTGLDTGLVLEDNQRVIGHGVDLVACGQTLVSASTRPTITHTAGFGITLASDNTIRGLNLAGTSGRGISGNSFGTATINNLDLTTSEQEALHLTNGTLAATIGTLSSVTSSAGGVLLDNVGGALMVTGSTTMTNPVGAGITVQNSPAGAAHDFGATSVTLAGTGGTPAHGVRIATNHAMAVTTFGSLSITTENGPGFEAPMGGIVDIESTGASVMANGGPAVNINATTGRTSGVDGWTFATLGSTGSPANGVVLTALPVNFTVGTSTTVTDATGTGILPTNNAGRTIAFGTTSVMDTNVGAGATGNGVDLRTGNAGATFNFASLSVVTDAGFGVAANNSGTVNVTGGGTGISATGAPAVDIASTALGMTVAGLSSSTSPTVGVNLNGVTGVLNAAGGAITSATGNAFDINAGTAVVTYGGSITNAAARAVEVTSLAGGTISFAGAIDEDGTGIRLNANGAGTVTFRGGMTLDTGANTALSATGGGTINVCATADCGAGAAVVNTIGAGTALTGTAVNIADTTIGGSGVSFRSISADHGASSPDSVVVSLDDTGAGTFGVTGDGTTSAGGNGSGGTIENLTDFDAIRFNNTDGRVTLANMIIEDIGHAGDGAAGIGTRSSVDGVHGERVDGGLTLSSMTMRRFSDNAILGSLLSNGTGATTWNGLEIRNSTIEDSNRYHLNQGGGGATDDLADDNNEGMVRIVGLSGTVVVDNSTFRRGAQMLDLFSASTGSVDMTVQRSSFITSVKEFRCTPPGTVNVGKACVRLEATSAADVVVRIGDPAEANPALGNTFRDCGTSSVRIAPNAGASGDVAAVISRNTFEILDHLTGPPGCAGGSLQFNHPQGGVLLDTGSSGSYEAIVSNNTFDQVMHAGGLEGQLTIIADGAGPSEFIVRGNNFQLPWDAGVRVLADGNGASAAVLFDTNTYTDGVVGTAADDVGFATTSPFNPFLVNVRNGGTLDLTIRDEVLHQHDDVFSAFSESFDASINASGGTLNLSITDTASPDGYNLERNGGTFNLFNEQNVAACPRTAAQIVDDNANTGGGNSDVTDPPTVVTTGTINCVTTAPTLPSITIP